MLKSLATAFAVSLLVLHSSPLKADDYPSKPIKILAGVSAGGPTDFLARLAAKYIAAKTGVQVVVENRFGASGTIAMGQVANSTPDGATLGFGASGDLMITQYLVQHISYDPLKALVPVALVADTPQVLSIAAQVPAHNVAEFIAYARANPGAVNYGSSGLGSTTQLGAYLFGKLAGLQLTHVLYRGSAAVTLDMVAGRIQMQHSSPLAVIQQARAGQIRMLVVARSERSPLLPDVPSASEAGLPGYVTPVWFGMVAPRATPKAIVDKLNSLMRDMVKDPEYSNLLTTSLFGAVPLTADEFEARVQREAPMWAGIVRDANVKAR